jgi:hypothetical protein
VTLSFSCFILSSAGITGMFHHNKSLKRIFIKKFPLILATWGKTNL